MKLRSIYCTYNKIRDNLRENAMADAYTTLGCFWVQPLRRQRVTPNVNIQPNTTVTHWCQRSCNIYYESTGLFVTFTRNSTHEPKYPMSGLSRRRNGISGALEANTEVHGALLLAPGSQPYLVQQQNVEARTNNILT